MQSEILDEIENLNIDNSNPIKRIMLIFFGTIILYVLLELIREYLPENLLEWKGIEIKTIGLMIIGIVIGNSILIPTYLNKLKPTLNIIKVIVYTGLILFSIEIGFKFIQNLASLNNGLNLNYLQILKVACMIGGIGMLLSNIRIHKLRGKKTLIPITLLIVIWIAGGIILNK